MNKTVRLFHLTISFRDEPNVDKDFAQKLIDADLPLAKCSHGKHGARVTILQYASSYKWLKAYLTQNLLKVGLKPTRFTRRKLT